MLAVASQFAERFEQQIPLRSLRLGRYGPHLIDDDRRSQIEGEPKCSLGGGQTRLEIIRGPIAAAGLEPDRANRQIQIIQHLPQLPEPRLGEILRKDLISRVDFHGPRSQSPCRVQGFLKGLAQTSQLNSQLYMLHDGHLAWQRINNASHGNGEPDMMLWLPLLILSTQTAAPMEHRYAETIFKTDFDQESDLNYDGWPDHWTRLRGQGFPAYINIGIVDDPSHASQQSGCLRIDLDGSGGTAFSPPIDISPLFSYLFQGKLKTEGLQHDVAYFTVTFYDLQRNQKETYTSERVTDATVWKEVCIGPITPTHPDARLAVIGLHLVPTSRSDLTGAAMFDDIRFARLPHMTIESSQPFNLFSNPCDPEFVCTVSGTRQPNSTLLLELLNVEGEVLAADELELRSVGAGAARLADQAVLPVPAGAEDARHAGSVTWRPPVPDYGFYRVRATLRGDADVTLQQNATLAVVPDLNENNKGEFGWSLPRGDAPLAADKLLTLLHLANVSWVKYPVWYSPETEPSRGEQIAEFADQLSAHDISLVGVFDHPPEQVRKLFSNKEHLTVAESFLESDLWTPVIDPLMIRLSLKIQWWQLGADDDKSFIDYGGLEQKIRDLRAFLRQYGQRMRVGLAWNWLHEPPTAPNPPWDFLALTASPAFTSEELARYATEPHESDTTNWSTMWPLDHDHYTVQTRAQDLVLRMVSAKVNGVEAAFIADPFDDSRGLLNDDGTPQELLLPWCITSRIVGGAKYLGSLQLPHGSHNYVFCRDNQAVMVVWNDEPVTESLYLGDNVVEIDPWGRHTDLSVPGKQLGQKQVVQVGPTPVFVTGLNLAVTRWRLGFSFEPSELESVFTRQQEARFCFHNTFRQGVGGTIRLNVPNVWDISNTHLRFKLAADDQLDQDFNIVLHSNASSGAQPIRVDFDVISDKEYRFSVYRQIQVGYGDIVVELNTWLDDAGNLVVEQHLINHTEKKLNFNCYLFAPGRRRMRMQVFDIGSGRVTHTFKLQNGAQLLGQTIWLRVEELGGTRLMNYHVVAEP